MNEELDNFVIDLLMEFFKSKNYEFHSVSSRYVESEVFCYKVDGLLFTKGKKTLRRYLKEFITKKGPKLYFVKMKDLVTENSYLISIKFKYSPEEVIKKGMIQANKELFK